MCTKVTGSVVFHTQMVNVYADPDGKDLFKSSLPAQSKVTKQEQVFNDSQSYHQNKNSHGGSGKTEGKGGSAAETNIAVSLAR